MNDDSSKLVKLNCPAHHQMLVSGLWSALTAQRGVDLLWRRDGRSLRAHRVVVEAFMAADQFDVSDGGVLPAAAADSQVVPPDVDGGPNLLDTILRFLYKGEVMVAEDQLDNLLLVAKELEFQMLIDTVESTRTFMSRRSRRQRKGNNPVKIVGYKEDSSDGDSDEEWPSSPSPPPTKRKARKGRGSRSSCKSELTKEVLSRRSVTSPVHEESSVILATEAETIGSHQQHSLNDSQDTERPDVDTRSSIAPPPTNAKVKSKATKSGKKQAGRSVGRPRTNTDPSVYRKCGQCNYETYSDQRFQVHLSRHDSSIKVVKCSVCDTKFAGDEALARHQCVIKSKHACPHCDYRTHDVVRYHVHLGKHDPSNAAPIFACSTCRRPFLSQETLDRHRRAQHAGGPVTFKCAHCPFETLKRITFHSHMFASHDLDMYGAKIVKKHKCPECELMFARPSQVKRHQTEKHSSDKPYKCRLCPYASVRNSDVYNHNRNVHLGIKKYMCDTCGFRSTSNHGLDRHKRIHTGERPFVCEVCGKAYGDPATLKWHSSCHESVGERPFVCHICGHSSSRQQYLNAHLRGVHKIPIAKSKGKSVES